MEDDVKLCVSLLHSHYCGVLCCACVCLEVSLVLIEVTDMLVVCDSVFFSFLIQLIRRRRGGWCEVVCVSSSLSLLWCVMLCACLGVSLVFDWGSCGCVWFCVFLVSHSTNKKTWGMMWGCVSLLHSHYCGESCFVPVSVWGCFFHLSWLRWLTCWLCVICVFLSFFLFSLFCCGPVFSSFWSINLKEKYKHPVGFWRGQTTASVPNQYQSVCGRNNPNKKNISSTYHFDRKKLWQKESKVTKMTWHPKGITTWHQWKTPDLKQIFKQSNNEFPPFPNKPRLIGPLLPLSPKGEKQILCAHSNRQQTMECNPNRPKKGGSVSQRKRDVSFVLLFSFFSCLFLNFSFVESFSLVLIDVLVVQDCVFFSFLSCSLCFSFLSFFSFLFCSIFLPAFLHSHCCVLWGVMSSLSLWTLFVKAFFCQNDVWN